MVWFSAGLLFFAVAWMMTCLLHMLRPCAFVRMSVEQVGLPSSLAGSLLSQFIQLLLFFSFLCHVLCILVFLILAERHTLVASFSSACLVFGLSLITVPLAQQLGSGSLANRSE